MREEVSNEMADLMKEAEARLREMYTKAADVRDVIHVDVCCFVRLRFNFIFDVVARFSASDCVALLLLKRCGAVVRSLLCYILFCMYFELKYIVVCVSTPQFIFKNVLFVCAGSYCET